RLGIIRADGKINPLDARERPAELGLARRQFLQQQSLVAGTQDLDFRIVKACKPLSRQRHRLVTAPGPLLAPTTQISGIRDWGVWGFGRGAPRFREWARPAWKWTRIAVRTLQDESSGPRTPCTATRSGSRNRALGLR